MRSDEASTDSTIDDRHSSTPDLTRAMDGAFGDALTDGRAETDGVVFAVVDAVAGLEGVTFAELPPLNDAVDPESLTNIFSGRDDGSVVFRYLGYVVRVDAGGRFAVYGSPPDDRSEPKRSGSS